MNLKKILITLHITIKTKFHEVVKLAISLAIILGSVCLYFVLWIVYAALTHGIDK
jgi:hypothetical protein